MESTIIDHSPYIIAQTNSILFFLGFISSILLGGFVFLVWWQKL